MLAVFVLLFSIPGGEAYAHGYGKTKGHHWDLEEKFSYKARFILESQDKLELSDKQAERIKDLKIKTKKALIRKNAELDILSLDLKTELRKDKIDTNAANELIDEKYELKKEKAKSLVEAYAALKDILTEEQRAKMKELHKKCKKGMMSGSMMKGKMKD